MRLREGWRMGTLLGLPVALALVACLSGCEALFGPKPLVATRLEVWRQANTATTSPASTQASSGKQSLVLDLTDGTGIFTDDDGKTYPVRIYQSRLEDLRGAIADRSWEIKDVPAAKTCAVAWYYVKVFNGKAVADAPVTWTEPSGKPLPPSINLIEGIFDEAARTAHPLSDKVDLTQ